LSDHRPPIDHSRVGGPAAPTRAISRKPRRSPLVVVTPRGHHQGGYIRRLAAAAITEQFHLAQIPWGAVALREAGAGEIVNLGWSDRQGQLIKGSQDP